MTSICVYTQRIYRGEFFVFWVFWVFVFFFFFGKSDILNTIRFGGIRIVPIPIENHIIIVNSVPRNVMDVLFDTLIRMVGKLIY